MINSERAIHFLPLILCSINKLKPHMLFACKNFKNVFRFSFSLGICHFWRISVQVLPSGAYLRSSWIYSHSWYKSAAQCLNWPQAPALHEHFPYKTSPVSCQKWTYTSCKNFIKAATLHLTKKTQFLSFRDITFCNNFSNILFFKKLVILVGIYV